MNLEYGKKYITRDGTIIGPLRHAYTYKNRHPFAYNGELWAPDGTSYCGEFPNLDIVRELNEQEPSETFGNLLEIEQLRIKVAYYEGECVQCYEVGYPYEGWTNCDGRFHNDLKYRIVPKEYLKKGQ